MVGFGAFCGVVYGSHKAAASKCRFTVYWSWRLPWLIFPSVKAYIHGDQTPQLLGCAFCNDGMKPASYTRIPSLQNNWSSKNQGWHVLGGWFSAWSTLEVGMSNHPEIMTYPKCNVWYSKQLLVDWISYSWYSTYFWMVESVVTFHLWSPYICTKTTWITSGNVLDKP